MSTWTHGCPRPLRAAECRSPAISLDDWRIGGGTLMVDVFESYVFRATDAYEAYVGRWSRPLAEAFLAWFAGPTAGRWLDVGCGTGALTEAVLAEADPRAVLGIDPTRAFLDAAQA